MAHASEKCCRLVGITGGGVAMSDLPKTMPAVMCHGPEDYRLEERAVPRPGPEEVVCLLYTSPSPRDGLLSRMPSSA